MVTTNRTEHAIDPKEFFSDLFGNAENKHFYTQLLSFAPSYKYTMQNTVDESGIDRLGNRVLDGDFCEYFGTVLMDNELFDEGLEAARNKQRRDPPKYRGGAELAGEFTFVHADIDCDKDCSLDGRNYPTQQEAIEYLKEMSTPPTIVVQTDDSANGRGLHAYWVLGEGETWVIDQDDRESDLKDALKFRSDFQRSLEHGLQQHFDNDSLMIDSTADLARVLRPVGSERDSGWVIKRLELNSCGDEYSIAEIRLFIAANRPPQTEPSLAQSSTGSGSGNSWVDRELTAAGWTTKHILETQFANEFVPLGNGQYHWAQATSEPHIPSIQIGDASLRVNIYSNSLAERLGVQSGGASTPIRELIRIINFGGPIGDHSGPSNSSYIDFINGLNYKPRAEGESLKEHMGIIDCDNTTLALSPPISPDSADAEYEAFEQQMEEQETGFVEQYRKPKVVVNQHNSADVARKLHRYATEGVYRIGNDLVDVTKDGKTKRLKTFDICDSIMGKCQPVTEKIEKGRRYQHEYQPKEIIWNTILKVERYYSTARELQAVRHRPVILEDGRLHPEGHDEKSCVLVIQAEDAILPPLNPTDEEKDAAIARILGLFDGCFWHEEEEDLPAAISFLLTLCLCDLLGGSRTPIFLMTANTSGSGKNELYKACAAIAGMPQPPVTDADNWSKEEWSKSLMSHLRAATPLLSFDNLTRPLGNSALDQCITEPVATFRELGGNDLWEGPCRTVFVATGQNIQLANKADGARRHVPIRFTRKFDGQKHQRESMVKRAERNSRQLYADVQTITLHWIQAGRPTHFAEPFNFADGKWNSTIRQIVGHMGLGDCMESQASFNSTSDETTGRIANFIKLIDWLGKHDCQPTTNELFACGSGSGEPMNIQLESWGDDFLEEIASEHKSSATFGKQLKADFYGKPTVDGRFVVQDRIKGKTRWVLVSEKRYKVLTKKVKR